MIEIAPKFGEKVLSSDCRNICRYSIGCIRMGRIDSVDSGNKKNIWTTGRTFYTGSGNRTRTYDISNDQ